jgi:flagellar basal body-associated protein FliL
MEATAESATGGMSIVFVLFLAVIIIAIIAGIVIVALLVSSRKKNSNFRPQTPITSTVYTPPKFCKKCGAVIAANNNFCGKCGTNQEESEVSK